MLSTALALTTKAVTSRSLLAAVISHPMVATSTSPLGHVVLESHCEQTLSDADVIDLMRFDEKPMSILAGIPISVKDNFNTVGLKTTAASRMLENYNSAYDAEVVTRIRAAGGIICAKANLDEFGMGSSMINSAFGACSSPWSKAVENAVTPGGSSGASAVLVASGVVTAAIGSDTGGSVRQPASFCGIVGLKPTYGSLSRHGLIAYASSMDTPGIMTKSVVDAAITFSALAGKDEKDPSSISTNHTALVSNLLGCDFPSGADITSDKIKQLMKLSSESSNDELKGMKVGIPHEFILDEMDSGIADLWKAAAKELENAGATVVTVSLPSYKLSLPCYYVLACAEASSNLSRFDGFRYGNVELAKANVGVSHSKAEGPKVSHSAHDFLQLIASSRGSLFGPEVIKRILTGTFVLTKGAIDNFYGKAQIVRQQIVKETMEAFDQEVDVMLFPTSPKLPFHLAQPPKGIHMLLHDIFTVTANITGCPAVSVPVDVCQGLPVGLQLMSKHNNELGILKAALALERRFRFHDTHRPPTSA
jgi:aspartyl-tRNA(Asn)/glutamyl-tRNA(Gln) amidotransferase subunit A